MKKENRINHVLHTLKTHTLPQSASKIGQELGVSRQIIVGDIALLRAQGHKITATSKGYLITTNDSRLKKTVSSTHRADQTQSELEIFVNHKIEVVDVWITHPVYQNIQGELNIKSNKDINRFLSTESPLLLSLTDGVHYHTLLCESEEDFEMALSELNNLGIITKVS